MAGMLPGVESARRRRLWSDSPSTIAAPNSTRRSCFCLYSSKHESLISSSSLLERNILYKARPDEELEEAVREAKERLDERFRAKSTR
ncbi:putative E3 ubiquitin-protein ligase RHY1A [Senna tora]|uniref:Putative E3 ubiquitin-protein ligase RHY1A n=1 Tax=Senna tora TaxID=362788 RepID=A0A834X7H3_9FABA|nr:putative E3 ubiquitin-protein ligase RHY1A [Senna tora]